MDRAIYEKARQIVEEKRVRLTDETDKRMYLEVEGQHDTYGVRMESDHTFACTCPYATLRGLPKGALCSHALAAMVFLAQEDPTPEESQAGAQAGPDDEGSDPDATRE